MNSRPEISCCCLQTSRVEKINDFFFRVSSYLYETESSAAERLSDELELLKIVDSPANGSPIHQNSSRELSSAIRNLRRLESALLGKSLQHFSFDLLAAVFLAASLVSVWQRWTNDPPTIESRSVCFIDPSLFKARNAN